MKNINEMYGKLAEAGNLLLKAYEAFDALDKKIFVTEPQSEFHYEMHQLEALTLGDCRRRSLVESYMRKLDSLSERNQRALNDNKR